jgi:hypothetical protein
MARKSSPAMPFETTMLFDKYSEKNKDTLTLLVAQALMSIAVEYDPVQSLMKMYAAGDVAPCVDFMVYHTTRLTADGNKTVSSPFKDNSLILVKALAYMDEAHVDYLLRFPKTPAALNNQQFLHIPLRRVLGRYYLTISLLQTMLVKGLRVIKRVHLHEELPDYGYDITTTTLSIVFDPSLQKIPTSIAMRWPDAVNVTAIRANSHDKGVWAIMWPQRMQHDPVVYEDAWETHY